MFRVLIVDDEPSAVEYIRSIIQIKCPELAIVGIAGNGQEGLRKFQELKPDLIISDVKMPVMDGLTMTKAIKERGEQVQILLISGYAEFEYARAALKYGVSDYVLKPVTPVNFLTAVEPVIRVMEREIYEQRKLLVRSMIAGDAVQEPSLRRYFPEENYFAAVIREGGLPRRFAENYESELISEKENTIFIYGRDERESLYICPEQALRRKDFHSLIQTEEKRKRGGSHFTTTIILTRSVPVESLAQTVEKLYKTLHSVLSIGVTQSIPYTEETTNTFELEKSLHAEEFLGTIQFFLQNQDYTMVLNKVEAMLQKAEETRCPQLQLERIIGQMSSVLRQYSRDVQNIFEEELLYEDAFYYAENSRELFESIKSICAEYWRNDREAVKLDSEEFLQSILTFINNHLAEELTVSSVCRQFGLSPSYLNLIFRKNNIESFNVYLRNVRIERAKKILSENPQIFIKDVALMTGYKDQFYFSRVFRAVTGVSPSQYIENGESKGEV